MEKLIKILGVVILVAFVGCEKNNAENNLTENSVIGYGNPQDEYELLQKLPMGDLNDAEKAGLLFMREEEKLARDVYTTLFEQYEENIFKNIARSEDRHTNAVLRLINRYELEDPVKSNEIGIFVNSNLQQLYDDLIAKGNSSLVAALLVGAEIEEIDILDLRKYMAEVEENDDIMFVYDNLLRGSRNHLRAFIKRLSQLEIEYAPQHLTQEDFDEIINSEPERGRKGDDGKRKGHGRKGGRGNRGNGGRR